MRFDYGSLVGSKINELKIVRFFRAGNEGIRKRLYYECECVCGRIFISRADHIKKGSCKSCGCLTISDLTIGDFRKWIAQVVAHNAQEILW